MCYRHNKAIENPQLQNELYFIAYDVGVLPRQDYRIHSIMQTDQ